MDQWSWSRLFWYVGWFGLGFLPWEILGFEKVVPWTTLSATLQHDIEEHPFFAMGALAGCIGLTTHWMFNQRLWPSLLFGASIAISAHFLDNKWP